MFDHYTHRIVLTPPNLGSGFIIAPADAQNASYPVNPYPGNPGPNLPRADAQPVRNQGPQPSNFQQEEPSEES